MKKLRNASTVRKHENKVVTVNKDDEKKLPIISSTIDSIQPFTASSYKHSDITHFKPTDIEKNIVQLAQSRENCSAEFEYPIKIYSDRPTEPYTKLEWPSIYHVKTLDELNPYSKLAYGMIFYEEKNNGFINTYKKFQGKYDIFPRYQEAQKNSSTSNFVESNESAESTETETKKSEKDDEMVKIVRGISKKGVLEMFPPVENVSVLSSKWVIDKKKLRTRYITLFQETPDRFYMLEIKNDEQSKSVRRWIDLEFCTQIKQGSLNNKKTIELYVNELIYVFTSTKADELTSWMTTLCTATGLEMDVQTGNTKSLSKYGNKSIAEADIWKTNDLSQLSEFSSDCDKKLIKKLSEDCEKLFNIYHCLFQSAPNVENPSIKKMDKTYVTLQIKSIAFDLRLDNNDSDKPIEPYIIDCFLYDANLNKKISENVYFDLQNEALINLNMPVVQHNVKDVVKFAKHDFSSKKINKYVFEVVGANQEIFLILRVMKLYDGGHYYDAYMKPDNKLAKKQCEYASTLSKSGLMYMTYFASAHKKIFNDKNELLVEEEELPLFKFDHKYFDTPKYLKETSAADVKSKIITYPGGKITALMKIVSSLDSMSNILTSSFEPFKTNKSGLKPLISSDYTVLSSSLADTRKSICPPFETFSNDLFIYPIEVNMTNCKSQIKNVILEFHIKDDNQRSSYPLFYSRYGNICMTETDSCTIVPKTLHPVYSEEFRVMLPQEITDNFHILVAYYSIDTKRLFKENKSKKLPKCLLGYSWVKILPNHGEYDLVRDVSLPAVSTLPENYTKYDLESPNIANEANNDLRWMDGQGRPIIKLELHYRSNVVCFDVTFKQLVNKAKSTPLAPNNLEEFSKLIKVCHVISDVAMTNGYNVIFQWLTNFLISANKLEMKSAQELDLVKSTASLFTHILNRLVSKDYGKILGEYINHNLIVYNKDGGYVHESLLRGLFEMIHIDSKKLESTFQNSWVFTKILLKSFKVLISNSFKYKQGNRIGIINQTTEEHLRWFMHSMIKYVINKVGKKSVRVMKVNTQLAKFVSELLNILDRNFVVGMISYLYETYKFYELKVEGLSDLKFDFLKVLVRNEFFLSINVPPSVLNKNLMSSGQSMILSQKYFKVHYLAAIIIDEVERSLTLSIENRTEAIILFRDLLVKHHFDDRYNDKNGQCLGVVMALYVPFLSVIVDNTHLFLQATKTKDNSEKADEFVTAASVSAAPTFRSVATVTSTSSFNMLSNKIGNSNMDITSSQHNNSLVSNASNYEAINKSLLFNNTRDLLICFLYIIQNVNKDFLMNWWTNFPKIIVKGVPTSAQPYFAKLVGEKGNSKYMNYLQFFALLKTAVDVFQHDKNLNIKKEFVLESLSNTTLKEGNNSTLGNKSKLKRALVGDSTFSNTDNALFQEITVLILDTIELFCKSQKMILKLESGNNPVMKIVLETYLHILNSIQSKKTMKYFLAHIRLFIQGKYFVIFKGNNNFLEKLFLELFEKLPFLDSEMRNEVNLFIYMILKANFYFTGNSFQRSYIKLICASTEIMDNNLVAKFVLRCVSNWTRLIKDDAGAKNNEFTNEIIDLNRRIQSILKVGQRMKKHVNDVETSIDILYNLSNIFSETPEILINWYGRMAETHEKNGFFSEAAMCALHSAVVYIQLLKSNDARTMKDDIELFRSISSNIKLLNFSSKKEDGSDFESIGIENLYQHLIKTSEYFAKSQRYEDVSTLFKCIIPILESSKSYSELGQIYKNMSDAYNNIADKNVSNNRNFGAYYRVAFYGKGFRENGGKNFIYKEPPYTPLATIKERLENIYTNSVGNVRIILEGGTMKTDSLDPNINYIQINGVIPIDEYKKNGNSDLTTFDINTNVRAFVLEIPFTPGGKAHGGIEDQWKRVTIFHTYHAFPYMKKRLNVTHKVVTELTPIKVAIDEMSLQVKQLQDVVNMYPPDMKRLQLKLQGSVSVTVNAGPVGYANTFASKKAEETHAKADITILRNVFRDFLSLCEKALQINSELVQSDQLLYHKDMCEKFDNLKNTISKIIDDQPPASK